MKIQLFALLLCSLLSNCASTQNGSSATSAAIDNSALATDKMTAEMVTHLKLSDVQTEQVKAINIKYHEKSTSLRREVAGDRSAMQSMRATLKKNKYAEMKQVLTANQYEQYISMEAENEKGRA